MPYDRHDRAHVLDDSRAYDVGLSDDAGGGNPLGFAIKVRADRSRQNRGQTMSAASKSGV